MPEMPHEQVYVRLGLSRIEGIGVLAIKPIPRGTNIFANDVVDLVWVDKSALESAGLSEAEQSLYHDFGIAREGKIGCPVNFHNLTPGWYLNEPPPGSEPNVDVDSSFNFRALRDIADGEELTVRYTQFSDPPESAQANISPARSKSSAPSKRRLRS